MKGLSATTRIALSIALLVLCFLLTAHMLGLIPNEQVATVSGRLSLCESVAITCSQHASRNEMQRAKTHLRMVVSRNPELLSGAIRDASGKIVAQSGDHASLWEQHQNGGTGDTHCTVPIARGREKWGQVELRSKPVQARSAVGWVQSPIVQLILFVVGACFLGNLVFLRRILRQLDPSKVIPSRVKSAFDTLTNGLILVDAKERIVMANQSFADVVGSTPEKLQGTKASSLNWSVSDESNQQNTEEVKPSDPPWVQAVEEGVSAIGSVLHLKGENDQQHTFLVNSAPIVGDDDERRGALVSFEDVTELMKKKNELLQMLHVLRESRERIKRQNSELQFLATRDTLTGCLNRRSLFTQFETLWETAKATHGELSVLMVDVDHFKSVNDLYGHTKGDTVLAGVAEILQDSVEQSDVVARFGGEEFCVLLPHHPVDEARQIGERIRKAVGTTKIEDLGVTVSVGVSSIHLGAIDQQHLLDEADKCLYVAKRRGRNRTVGWDEIDGDDIRAEGEVNHVASLRQDPQRSKIPFHAVTALISALGYRHTDTAEHSRRVADLCVALGSNKMSLHDTYILEVAALLHDIGKVGVPDSILLKPGNLTNDEWKVMRDHDRIGVEIVRATFECGELSRILETHTAWFGGRADGPGLPKGTDIPVSARVLAIADAFDAMVSDRVYRAAVSYKEAFAELRRCAGTQFDPDLVEEFIRVVLATDGRRHVQTSDLPKQTALKIGQEIEQLAEVLDNHDVDSLRILSRRLATTAHQLGIEPIATLASEISDTVDTDPELSALINLTNELISLCRSTQGAYLHGVTDHVDVAVPSQ